MEYELYQGDCLEVMPTLNRQFDAIITDLPYGTTQCSWDSIIPLEPMWTQVRRLLKPNGVFVSSAGQPFASVLITSNLDWFKYCWIWEKSKASGYLNVNIRPLVAHEDIAVFAPNGNHIYNPHKTMATPYNKGSKLRNTAVYGSQVETLVKSDDGTRNPRTVIYFHTAESEGKTNHPTQKPVALYEYLVRTYTNEGDTVLDFCMGSGTTGIACHRSNRNFVGIEKEPKYFDIAQKRILEATQQTSLFGS